MLASPTGEPAPAAPAPGELHLRISELVGWIRRHGGAEGALVVQAYVGSTERGLHAARDVAAGEELCTIPLRCIVTAEMGRDTAAGRRVARAGLTLGNPKQTMLALVLLAETRRPAAESHFSPYLVTLPPSYDNLPMCWPAEDLARLAGSNVAGQAAAMRAEMAADYGQVCAAADADFRGTVSLEQFTWARLAVSSRCMEISLSGAADSTCVLVPLVDMCNHLAQRECGMADWGFDRHAGVFRMTARHAIPRGAQVGISYGEKCNSLMALHYGFAQEENVWNAEVDALSANEVSMCFSTSATAPPLLEGSSREAMWESAAASSQGLAASTDPLGSKRIGLQADASSEAFARALALLRVLHADAAADEALLDSATPLEFPFTGFSSCATEPVSLCNEIAMLSALRVLVCAALAAYPHSLAEDDRALPALRGSFTNSCTALLVVRGEKQILAFIGAFATACLSALQPGLSAADQEHAGLFGDQPAALAAARVHVAICVSVTAAS